MSGKARLTGRFGESAKRHLKVITGILEQSGVTYCLESGTLLGIVRENRLLPWDDDLDLFAPNTEVSKLMSIRWKFWLRGYKVSIRRFMEDHGPLKTGDLRIYKVKTLGLFGRQKLLVDIIVKYPQGEHYYWSMGMNPAVNKRVAREHYDTLDSLTFDGKRYPIPGNVELYLTRRYGDWKVPDKTWSFKTDDKAAINPGSESSE